VTLLGTSELKAVELPGQLQFVAVSESGWIDLPGVPLVLIVFATAAWISGRIFFALSSAFVLVAVLAKTIMNYPDGSKIKLFVSQSDLIARGDLGRTFTTR
jgi:hypothetical protein